MRQNEQLYLDNGWINFDFIWNLPTTFIFLVGARGIGKTYGAFKYTIENQIPFIFMRRTAKQLEMINKRDNAACNSYLRDKGIFERFTITMDGDSGIYRLDEERFCQTLALSTISNVRGFDGSWADAIIFDEFIPEDHERPMRGECDAFLNAYETINRNRELNGLKPVKCICMANSNKGANAIFNGLNLVRTFTKMQKNNKSVYICPQRDVAIIRYDNSPISNAKKKTALYKLTNGLEFQEMALNNNAHDISEFVSKRVNIRDYRAVVRIGKLTVYHHKYESRFYVTEFHTGTCPVIEADKKGLKEFQAKYFILKAHYVEKHIYFGEYDHEVLFREYLNINLK